LKNELNRLGRSHSPIRYHGDTSPAKKVPVRNQNGRSVSPYMSAPKTPRTINSEERYSSVKRMSDKKRQESPRGKTREVVKSKEKEKVKEKEKEEARTPRKKNE